MVYAVARTAVAASSAIPNERVLRVFRSIAAVSICMVSSIASERAATLYPAQARALRGLASWLSVFF